MESRPGEGPQGSVKETELEASGWAALGEVGAAEAKGAHYSPLLPRPVVTGPTPDSQG